MPSRRQRRVAFEDEMVGLPTRPRRQPESDKNLPPRRRRSPPAEEEADDHERRQGHKNARKKIVADDDENEDDDENDNNNDKVDDDNNDDKVDDDDNDDKVDDDDNNDKVDDDNNDDDENDDDKDDDDKDDDDDDDDDDDKDDNKEDSSSCASASASKEKAKKNDEEEGKPFLEVGPYVGSWITRSVIDDRGLVSSLSVGKIAGYLGPEDADYVDKNGEPCALWRVEYVSGELEGDAEDLEEWEVLASAPRPTREQSGWATLAPVAADAKKQKKSHKKKPAALKTTTTLTETTTTTTTTDMTIVDEQNTGAHFQRAEEEAPREESEYERLRRERIEANERFLKQLGLSSKKDRDEEAKEAKAKKRRTRAEMVAAALGELGPARRSVRSCVVMEPNKYSEDRAYKLALDEAKRDALYEKEKHREWRHQKEAERRRELQDKKAAEHERKMQRRREQFLTQEAHFLKKRCLAVEKDMAKKMSQSDRVAARYLAKPSWLANVGSDWTPFAEPHTLYDDVQVGDRFFYFVEGHKDYLKKKHLVVDDGVVPWFLRNAPPRLKVLDCVVTRAMPCFPEVANYVEEKLAVLTNDRDRKRNFNYFATPVDTALYPEYLQVVKNPMDFSTIAATNYKTTKDFTRDVLLVFDNALKFNTDDSPVGMAAQDLKDVFLADLAKDEDTKRTKVTTGTNEDIFALDNDNDQRQQMPQRLLVRVVPTFYLEQHRFDDLNQDEQDGEAKSNQPKSMLGYLQQDETFALVQPFSLWLTNDCDFFVPRHLVAHTARQLLEKKETSQKPTVVLDESSGDAYTVRCVKGATSDDDDDSECCVPRWKGVKLTPIGQSGATTKSVFKNAWELRHADDDDAPPEVTDGETNDDDEIVPFFAEQSRRLDRKYQEEGVLCRHQKPAPKADDDASDAWTLTAPLPKDDTLNWDFQPGVAEASESLIKVLDAIHEYSTLAKPWFEDEDDDDDDDDENDDGDENDDPSQNGRHEKNNHKKKKGDDDDLLEESSSSKAVAAACPREPTFDEIRDKLRRRVYRRPSAVYEDLQHVYFAEACRISGRDTSRCSLPEEKRVLGAKLAAQMCTALCAHELLYQLGQQQEGETTVNLAGQHTPWQSFIRQSANIKTNTGMKIREHCKLAIAAARRDLSHDAVLVRAVVAELRLALLKYRGNAAGPCRETGLDALDVYGGWHFGADATADRKDTVTYVKDGSKIVAELTLADNDASPWKKPPLVHPGDRLLKRLGDGGLDAPYVFGTVEVLKLGKPRQAIVRWAQDESQEVLAMRSAANTKLQSIALPRRLYRRLFKPKTKSDDEIKRHPKIVGLRLSHTKLLCTKDVDNFLTVAAQFNLLTNGAAAATTSKKSPTKKKNNKKPKKKNSL